MMDASEKASTGLSVSHLVNCFIRIQILMKVVVQVTTGVTDAESPATFAPGVPAVVGDRGQASGRTKKYKVLPAAL